MYKKLIAFLGLSIAFSGVAMDKKDYSKSTLRTGGQVLNQKVQNPQGNQSSNQGGNVITPPDRRELNFIPAGQAGQRIDPSMIVTSPFPSLERNGGGQIAVNDNQSAEDFPPMAS